MNRAKRSSPLPLAQLLAWVRDLSTQEKNVILRELLDESATVTMASEPSLAKDWNDKEEDEAWKDL